MKSKAQTVLLVGLGVVLTGALLAQVQDGLLGDGGKAFAKFVARGYGV